MVITMMHTAHTSGEEIFVKQAQTRYDANQIRWNKYQAIFKWNKYQAIFKDVQENRKNEQTKKQENFHMHTQEGGGGEVIKIHKLAFTLQNYQYSSHV